MKRAAVAGARIWCARGSGQRLDERGPRTLENPVGARPARSPVPRTASIAMRAGASPRPVRESLRERDRDRPQRHRERAAAELAERIVAPAVDLAAAAQRAG